jgi:hypothetical protein
VEAEEERRARIAQNESLYRNVNERIEDINRVMAAVAPDLPFTIVCECGDLACVQQVEVTADAYEAVRAEPTYFIVVPGHSIEDVEEVVERRDTYEVVCKNRGLGKAVAQLTDPRS